MSTAEERLALRYLKTARIIAAARADALEAEEAAPPADPPRGRPDRRQTGAGR